MAYRPKRKLPDITTKVLSPSDYKNYEEAWSTPKGINTPWGKWIYRDDLEDIQKLAKYGLNESDIADLYRLAPDEWREVVKECPEIPKYFRQGVAQAVKKVAGKMLDLADRGHFKAMEFVLAHRAGWEKGSRPLQDLSGAPDLRDEDYEINTIDPIEAAKKYRELINNEGE